ncbi:MAG: carboxypeptidase-like regulatory domain-containing protein [Blastocatellales bacterium]
MKDCYSVRSALIAMLVLLLIGSTTLGQATRSSLSRLISDQTGAAVSGARINAKHIATNEGFQTTTDAQGAFIFPSMPLGQYAVTIEAAGFKRLEAQGITIEVGTPAKLNVAMEVGAVSAGRSGCRRRSSVPQPMMAGTRVSGSSPMKASVNPSPLRAIAQC